MGGEEKEERTEGEKMGERGERGREGGKEKWKIKAKEKDDAGGCRKERREK